MKNEIKQILREGLILETRIKTDMYVPEDILEIANIFKNNGYKLYIVGGAVRDFLLNKKIKDYDLATDAIPDRVEEIMAEAGFRTLPTGKAFGVINVFTDQGEYEVATFRNDVYNAGNSKLEMPKVDNDGNVVSDGGRRPDSVTFTNIEGDVKRRDLTINALFYDIDTHEVVDLVGGVNDLKNGVVRTVGAAEDRFGEDRLRILRAIRFAGRFGSELDSSTDAALRKDASLEGISGERIRDEFLKGITSAKSVKQFLGLIDKYSLFDWVFRGLNVNKDFIENNDTILVLATLLRGNSLDSLGKQLNGLKYSSDEIKSVTFLIALLRLSVDTAVSLKRAQKHSGVTPEQMKAFGKICGIDSRLMDTFIKFDLSVSGPELMDKMNLKPGAELGKAIHKVETDNFKNLLG